MSELSNLVDPSGYLKNKKTKHRSTLAILNAIAKMPGHMTFTAQALCNQLRKPDSEYREHTVGTIGHLLSCLVKDEILVLVECQGGSSPNVYMRARKEQPVAPKHLDEKMTLLNQHNLEVSMLKMNKRLDEMSEAITSLHSKLNALIGDLGVKVV